MVPKRKIYEGDSKLKTTVIGATLNEIEAIQVVLPELAESSADEVLIVDGGSTDGTVEYCRNFGGKVKILENCVGGYGAAIMAGVKASNGDIIIEFPPDGNSLAEKIPEVVEEIKKGYDFVIVSRYKDGAKSHDDDFMTAIGNWGFTTLTNLLFGTSYTDVLVGYRAYRKSAFFELGLDSPGLSWVAQEAIRFATHGFKVGDIGGDEPERIGGERKMRIFKTGFEILSLIFREYRHMKNQPKRTELDKSLSTNIESCRICGSTDLTRVMDFGAQYLATVFVSDNANHGLSDMRVPLSTVLCSSCGLLQLEQTVDRSLLFSEYFYRSGTNPMMRTELKDIVEEVCEKYPEGKGVFLDIGCNDGSLLSVVPDRFKRIGIEPAKNISWVHLDPSITVRNDFFSNKVLLEESDGQLCQIITSIAMLYSVDHLTEIVSEIKSVLAEDGIWCIQVSYLPTMLESMSFYDICHEHLYYFSLDALSNLLERSGLKVIDGSLNEVNGGSLRVFVVHQDDPRSESQHVKDIRTSEENWALQDVKTYKKFFQEVLDLKERTTGFLQRENEKGNLVIGLGASTKGNVLLQFFEIDKNLLPYISERNPEKVSLRTLGTDIELVSEADARKLKPDYMLVLIWFFKDEIIRREKDYLDQGGKLLFPMPYLHVVSRDGEERL